ncbi:unnamed protein product [Rotaria sp. Silwood2]|nr:unnamed protein product [Rotaria sp. Silwood2]CAF2995799.1 unnamed protein product [Rotaria sp. Silwood2]CAF3158593.1 unnamed protein product [Rotaria sp. Silwood2]CAF3970209.1 unnamed protein product [Rotaria sp. Silwood2]CAF4133751.1 unnamed protein product [Rotaria sp. Silwood2]
MSYKAPSDRAATDSLDGRSNNINAGIDSGFTNNQSHRGSLTPSELDAIHQTNSFIQAKQLEEKDNRQLTDKMKKHEQAKKQNE